MKLTEAAAALQTFTGSDLTRTLAQIEVSIEGTSTETCPSSISQFRATAEALRAAGIVKRMAGQINVAVHALGILLCLPHVLQAGEVVEYVSLGAGNTGRSFDLETNRRVAEFKFIRWQGGPEAIRQNSLFKDFFWLAEYDASKQKFLYVLGTEYPLKFLHSRRSLDSVLSRNVALKTVFQAKYPNEQTVRDYYLPHREAVTLQDVSPWLPDLVGDFEGTEEAAP